MAFWREESHNAWRTTRQITACVVCKVSSDRTAIKIKLHSKIVKKLTPSTHHTIPSLDICTVKALA
eukprot:242488-Pleurochrysis_carterae.AAC.1